MNILFLGGVFTDSDKADISKNSIGGVQYAADTLQKHYIRGFSKNGSVRSTVVINLPFIGSYPNRYKALLYCPKKKAEYFGRTEVENVGFVNLAIIKHPYRLITAARAIRARVKKYGDESVVLVCYSMHLPFLVACYLTRLRNRRIKLLVIVPDLPEYMSCRDGLSKIAADVLAKFSYAIVNRSDCIVAITKHMLEAFSHKPTKVVIEGIGYDDPIGLPLVRSEEKYFLYSGTLDRRYGVRNLVESYLASGVDKYKLYICGDGDERDYLMQVVARNQNVVYLGQLNKDEALRLQWNASLLINPRSNDLEFTKYSFPSKVIEYMVSGVPVLMYKLDGVPCEYYDYCFTIPPEEDGIKQKLIEFSMLNENDARAKGRAARKFILANKSPEVQVGKLISILNEERYV